jgi:hypothetical protein
MSDRSDVATKEEAFPSLSRVTAILSNMFRALVDLNTALFSSISIKIIKYPE